jgi:hypothetical protein
VLIYLIHHGFLCNFIKTPVRPEQAAGRVEGSSP